MATYTLPNAPSSWNLRPVPNVQGFGAANLDINRSLVGGSRYILELAWDVRHGVNYERLQNVLEAASIPGDDLRIRFATDLGYVHRNNCAATTRAVAAAGGRNVPVNVSGGAVPAGALFSAGGRLYRNRLAVSQGGGRTMLAGWPLRAEIASGTALNLADPTAEFILLDQPPNFPTQGRSTAGELYGSLSISLIEKV